MNRNWIRRRWLDFRNGHSIYLIFAMTFANFITIQYGLLIDRVPQLSSIFTSIWFFAIVFVVSYLPLAMVIGYWHRKSQWSVEQEALFKENKVAAILWLYIFDLFEGKVSEQEKKDMRDTLLSITKGQRRFSPPKQTEEESNESQTKKSSKMDEKSER